MKELNKNWLTEGWIDFEYKKYILLAYLKEVRENFGVKKLYPFLSDLIFHYNNLTSLKENKKLLHENFPKQITKADFEKLQLIYEEMINDDGIMQELEEIIAYAIPKFKEGLVEGKDIYENIEDKMTISPVGLTPLNSDAGYLLFFIEDKKETPVYEYQISLFQAAEAKYRGVHTSFVETFHRSISNTFESIKLDLIRKYKKMPNPATFLVDTRVSCPMDETLLPIAKRMLVKQIYSKSEQ